MDRISSRQHPVVKRFRELARAGAGAEQVLLDGEHLVAEAFASGIPIELVAVAERFADDRAGGLLADLERAGVKTQRVTEPVLAAISPVRHPTGIVAIGRCRPASLDQAFQRAPQLVLLVADVQDPGNVGAIVRTAEACGATGVVTTAGSADPFGWKALRGAMGSTFRVPVVTRSNLSETIAATRRSGVKLFATVPRAGADPAHVDLTAPCAILLGGEGSGLLPTIVNSADERLTLPMRAPVESLNVSIAAAMLLYEASRQRRRAGIGYP